MELMSVETVIIARKELYSFFFFFRYFLHLHFRCYPEIPLYTSTTLLPNLSTPTSWPWHSSVLGHIIFTRRRASPSIDGLLDHPLLHMQLETQLWGEGGYWLVHIVVPPIGLQTPSSPWVLSLALSLGALCSIQQMTVSIHFCICQALA